MKHSCPNSQCFSSSVEQKIYRDGSYYRPSDGRVVQRFKCKNCGKKFSSATFQAAYKQNKRRINHILKGLFSSGNSQRRCAKLLGVARKTIERKFKFLGRQAKIKHSEYLKDQDFVNVIQFDDLQTIEGSKCKPISVCLAVESKTRKIIDFEVSQMPATGHLSKISRENYGYRKDQRQKGIDKLFSRLKKILTKDSKFVSDQHPYYLPAVNKYFPRSDYIQFKGRSGSIAGQGELKKLGQDPLFYINHTFAMLRANINRLIRKTWCTTKKLERLRDHLYIYVNYHNTELI